VLTQSDERGENQNLAFSKEQARDRRWPDGARSRAARLRELLLRPWRPAGDRPLSVAKSLSPWESYARIEELPKRVSAEESGTPLSTSETGQVFCWVVLECDGFFHRLNSSFTSYGY
jgi:hypothetical protein